MKTIKTLINSIAVCFFAVSIPAHAMTGNVLYEFCNPDHVSPLLEANCDAYILGIFDGLRYMNNLESYFSNEVKPLICLPSGVTPRQIIDIGRRYLSSHPETRNEPASNSMFIAFLAAFPCSKE